jgi:hypothetical protein
MTTNETAAPAAIGAEAMPVPAWRNPVFTASGRIDCEIEHPRLGWLPFRLDPDDTGADFDVAALHAEIVAAGGIAPYQPPSAAEILAQERATMRCSRFQARAALHNAGLLQAVEQAVAASDPFVQIAWQDATEFHRNSPTIAALQAALGLSGEDLDDLFRAARLIVA